MEHNQQSGQPTPKGIHSWPMQPKESQDIHTSVAAAKAECERERGEREKFTTSIQPTRLMRTKPCSMSQSYAIQRLHGRKVYFGASLQVSPQGITCLHHRRLHIAVPMPTSSRMYKWLTSVQGKAGLCRCTSSASDQHNVSCRHQVLQLHCLSCSLLLSKLRRPSNWVNGWKSLCHVCMPSARHPIKASNVILAEKGLVPGPHET